MLPAQTCTPGPALVQEGKAFTNTPWKMPGPGLQPMLQRQKEAISDRKRLRQCLDQDKATHSFYSMVILGPMVRPLRLKKPPASESVPVPQDREEGGGGSQLGVTSSTGP